uniref:Inhibitor of growth protein n=1 Tax=Anopheles dirus TaxID=7168 RepID=A0A182N4A3_9DIPT
MIGVGTVTVEAHYSTNYVENYLDSVENLPDDVQRHLSRIREIDVLYQSHLRDVNTYCEQLSQHATVTGGTKAGATSETSSTSSTAPGPEQQSHILKRATSRIQKSLIAAQELGDEKLQIIQQLQDLIDHKTRQLDQDFMNLGNEFFVRLDYAREDKAVDGAGRDGSAAGMIGSTSSMSNNGPGHGYGGVAGNGAGNGPNGSGGYGAGVGGTGGAGGGIGSSSHIIHATNGTGVGVASVLGGGNGSGMYGGSNGGGSNERSSKRARRTRNEQGGGGSANGSNTPNSLCGVSAMEVDAIEDSIGGGIGGGSGPGSGGSGSGGGGGGGNGGLGGNVSLSGGNGGSNAGGIKQESGGNGNGGSGAGGSSGSSHNSISGPGAGQTQSSTMGGSGGSKNANGGGGNGGGNGSNAMSGAGSNTSSGGGNGGGGGGASGSSSHLNSSNQGSSKKGTGSGSNTGSGGGAGGANSGKKKKRKTGGRGSQATREAREDTPAAEETIDPDEPTYCLCDQISFGEMILCDNDLCPIEWFHFSCVSLISKPKGRWFCPNCRGDRPNVMKPKAQFLKELERYNKEKEEKT